jgi:type IV pilus assembly protein PilB
MQKKEEKTILDALIKGSYINAEDLKRIELSAQNKNASVLTELLDKGVLTPHLLGEAMGEFYGVHFADFSLRPSQREVIQLIPEDVAKKYTAAVFQKKDDEIIVATDNPGQKELLSKLKSLFPKITISLAYASASEIAQTYYHFSKPISERLEKFLAKKDATVPEVLNTIFQAAIELRASDIHFEPQNDDVQIRIRVDGMLHIAGRLPHDLYHSVINRIKILANLRIDEHFITQDGALRFPLAKGEDADMRISVVPTVFGETIVIRQLTKYVSTLNLNSLGLNSAQQQIVATAAKKPFGMLLSVGPTGSGKTTTLYSIITLLNQQSINITTIEDPVEYLISGINQIQVNVRTDITFAKGLRSIVRQDPNVIMVGEIRDEETAEIAINAALTGHLLLSTFHANDAPTSIPRLLDMGIEPFLLASTLEVVIAQRLVPRICNVCKISIPKDKEMFKRDPWLKEYFPEDKSIFYGGKGCATCSFTGQLGRIPLFEVLPISPAMEELILKRPSSKDVWELAIKEGMKSMFEDGIDKVQSGIITLDNLLRVSSPTPYKN